ncbi:MAG: hypothetical protein WC791_04450 [Candidatus Paceibacterota bacterium]|jgi:uridine kinase
MTTVINNQIQEIINKLVEIKPSIVVIDGEDGVGKTHVIAPLMANALDAHIFSIDNYLDNNKGGYVDFVDYEKLKQDISNVKDSKPVVLEGLMMLLVVKKLGMVADYFLYVGSISWVEEWLGDGGNYEKPLNNVISKIENNVNLISKLINSTAEWKMPKPREEIYQYTYNYKPFENAQAVLIV